LVGVGHVYQVGAAGVCGRVMSGVGIAWNDQDGDGAVGRAAEGAMPGPILYLTVSPMAGPSFEGSKNWTK